MKPIKVDQIVSTKDTIKYVYEFADPQSHHIFLQSISHLPIQFADIGLNKPDAIDNLKASWMFLCYAIKEVFR